MLPAYILQRTICTTFSLVLLCVKYRSRTLRSRQACETVLKNDINRRFAYLDLIHGFVALHSSTPNSSQTSPTIFAPLSAPKQAPTGRIPITTSSPRPKCFVCSYSAQAETSSHLKVAMKARVWRKETSPAAGL